MMKRIVAAAAIAVCLWFTPALASTTETFDSSTDGWGISLIDSNGNSWSLGATFSASGGNPCAGSTSMSHRKP